MPTGRGFLRLELDTSSTAKAGDAHVNAPVLALADIANMMQTLQRVAKATGHEMRESLSVLKS